MEVNCAESSALNKGSSEVTCTSGTEFSFEFNEPECINTGIVEADTLTYTIASLQKDSYTLHTTRILVSSELTKGGNIMS